MLWISAAPMRLRILAVVLLSACGGNGAPSSVATDTSPAPGTPFDSMSGRTLIDACGDLAAVRCRELTLCGSFLDRARYADVETCVSEVQLECVAARSLPGVLGAVARADACARNLAALDCAHRRDPLAQEQACSAAVERGTLVDGAPCVRDNQCAGGLCERGARGCGVCVRAPVAGDRCASTAECGALLCNLQLGRCEPAPKQPVGTAHAGESCDTAVCDRGDGLECMGAEWLWCVAPQVVPLGGSCADAASGLPVVCAAPSARCDRATWTCAPRIAVGAPCDAHDDCITGAACVRSDGRFRCVKESTACR